MVFVVYITTRRSGLGMSKHCKIYNLATSSRPKRLSLDTTGHYYLNYWMELSERHSGVTAGRT